MNKTPARQQTKLSSRVFLPIFPPARPARNHLSSTASPRRRLLDRDGQTRIPECGVSQQVSNGAGDRHS